MMSVAALEARLVARENLGPWGSQEGLEADLHDLVAELGEHGAPVLVEVARAHTAHKLYDIAVIYEVLEAYARKHAQALARAVRAKLDANGPTTLVVALGMTRVSTLVADLQVINLNHDALAIAVIETLSEVATGEARAWLDALARRSWPEAVRSAFADARKRLAMTVD